MKGASYHAMNTVDKGHGLVSPATYANQGLMCRNLKPGQAHRLKIMSDMPLDVYVADTARNGCALRGVGNGVIDFVNNASAGGTTSLNTWETEV